MSRKARAVPVFMPLLYHSSGLRQEVRITVQERESCPLSILGRSGVQMPPGDSWAA